VDNGFTELLDISGLEGGGCFREGTMEPLAREKKNARELFARRADSCRKSGTTGLAEEDFMPDPPVHE